MSDTEKHATRAPDWRDHAGNLVEESYRMGAMFVDTRRLMLVAWEGWTSGEPSPGEIVYELLSTIRAMTMQSGLDETIGAVLEEAGATIERLIVATPNDEGEA